MDAALAAFANRGFEATSLDALASDLGVRKQTILYHFGSKDDLLHGVIRHAAAEISALLGRAATRSAAAPARATARLAGTRQTTAIVDSVFRIGARRPELIVLLREVSRLGPSASRELANAVEPLVADAVAALGEAGVDPRRARRVLLGAAAKVVGLATEVEVLRELGVGPDRSSLRRQRRELLGFVEAGLGGPGSAIRVRVSEGGPDPSGVGGVRRPAGPARRSARGS